MNRGRLVYKDGKTRLQPSADEMFTGWQTIRIFGAEAYGFEGYKTDILRWLQDHGDKEFTHAPLKDWAAGTLKVRLSRVRESTTKEVAGYMQGMALGAMGAGTGAVMEMVGVIQTGLQLVVPVVMGSGAPEAATGQANPGRVANTVDRAFGKKVVVEICAYVPPRTGKYDDPQYDTKFQTITFSNVADVLTGLG